ncbi:MAG: DJ-1/PfpI family protein, partial [Coprobacillus sp.]
MRAIVLFKEGFEEVEALSVVDVLRRMKITCDMVGMDCMEVTSSHQITVRMDKLFDEKEYDADVVILPGGLPGATSLRDDQRVIQLLKDFNNKGKWIAAICAGPISLETAGVISGKKFTCSPGFEKQIPSGIH